jgi:LCP family protein required for cell wall assembly
MWIVIAVSLIAVLGVIVRIASVPGRAPSGQNGSAAFNPAIVPPSAAPLASNGQITIRPWDAKRRFTILVLGIDRRPDETIADSRTDTMILVSVDPTSRSIGMLSIPRDLYVPFPGETNLQQINTAYVFGELKKPGGGPEFVIQTIQYNFAMSVNAYAVVSFDTVIGIVDAVGGVDIDVPYDINDPEYPDMNYGYDPLFIPKGPTHMDGALALKYARTRHQTDDFDRTKRQQQVILAIRQKALGDVPHLVSQAPALWQRINSDVITNLSFDQWASLAWYLKDFSTQNIHNATINGAYIHPVLYQGDTVLTVDRSTIGTLLSQTFGADYSK